MGFKPKKLVTSL